MALIVGWLVHRLVAGGDEGGGARRRSRAAARGRAAHRRRAPAALAPQGRLRVARLARRADAARRRDRVCSDARAALARALRRSSATAFLALIADETGRLAALVGEVTDTSRIDSGTFSYTFGDVDVAALVDEAVAAAELARDSANIDLCRGAARSRTSRATRCGSDRC